MQAKIDELKKELKKYTGDKATVDINLKTFDEEGNPTSDSTREHAAKFMRAFATWVATNTPGGGQ